MAMEGKNGFDGRMVAKLFALLDSPQDAEAAGALHRLRLLTKKSGIRLYEAVEARDYKAAIWETFEPECLREYFGEHGGKTEELRAEVMALRAELDEARRGGDELAQALAEAEQAIEQLRRTKAKPSGVGFGLYAGAGMMTFVFLCRFWPRLVLALAALGIAAAMMLAGAQWVRQRFRRK